RAPRRREGGGKHPGPPPPPIEGALPCGFDRNTSQHCWWREPPRQRSPPHRRRWPLPLRASPPGSSPHRWVTAVATAAGAAVTTAVGAVTTAAGAVTAAAGVVTTAGATVTTAAG